MVSLEIKRSPFIFLPRSSSGSGGDSNTRGIRIPSSPPGLRTEPAVVAGAGSTSLHPLLSSAHNIKVGQNSLHLPPPPPPLGTQYQGWSEQASPPPPNTHTTSRLVKAGSTPTLPSAHNIKVGQSRLLPPPPNPPLGRQHQGRSEQAPTLPSPRSGSGREK